MVPRRREYRENPVRAAQPRIAKTPVRPIVKPLLPVSNVARRLIGLLLSVGVFVSCAYPSLPGSSVGRSRASLRAAEHDHGSVALKELEGRALADIVRAATKLPAPDAVQPRRLRTTSPRRSHVERYRARVAIASLPRRNLYRMTERSTDAPDLPA